MPEPVGRVANSPERADLPEGKPDPAVQKSRAEIKLWVQLVHGMNEHMGRYGEFAAFLAEHGIAVIGHDCLGHGSTAAYGATELSKEDRGFFAAENGGAFLLRDMRRVASYGAKRYPNAKHIMLGHSMGSFLTRRYLSAYPGKEPDGVILLGTGFPAKCWPLYLENGRESITGAVCSMSFPSETITGNSSRCARTMTGLPEMSGMWTAF